jgi:hypothetical protein
MVPARLKAVTGSMLVDIIRLLVVNGVVVSGSHVETFENTINSDQEAILRHMHRLFQLRGNNSHPTSRQH